MLHRQLLTVACLVIGFGMVANWCDCTVTPAMANVAIDSHAAEGDVHDHGDHTHEDHGHHEEGANPFAWQTDLALWSLVVFAILVAILGFFAFKPIAQALDQREQSVANNIAGAERANQEAKDLLAQYQDKLSEAEGEVKAIVEAGKKEAERAGEVIVAKARDAAEAERIRATKEIESATDGALQELAKRSADLAVKLAGKIISKDLDAGSHADLIDSAVSDFSKN